MSNEGFESSLGFTYQTFPTGEVRILHHGKLAATLRGEKTKRFLRDVAEEDEQQLMARLTGNYKHGNERQARNHPRNR